MTTNAASLTRLQVSAALAVGTIAVLVIGLQPILLGALVEARQVTLEGVGLVAMAEIVTVGLGVALGDALLPVQRLRAITIAAGLLAAVLDACTLRVGGDVPMLAVRAAAGLAEGVLVWGTTGVVVRTRQPDRTGGLFFVVQTLAQALVGAALATWVIPAHGWQGGFAVLGGAALLAGALAFVQPASLAPLPAPEHTGFRWSAATVLPLVVVFLQMSAIGSLWAYLEPIGQAAGLDAKAAQTLISGVLAVQVVGGLVATALVRRVSVVPTVALGSVVLGSATLFAHQLAPGSLLAFSLACAVFGFTWLLLLPFHIGLAFRADASGRVAMLVPAAQLVGSAFGPLVASFAVQGDDASAVPLVSSAFAVAAIAVLALARRPRR